MMRFNPDFLDVNHKRIEVTQLNGEGAIPDRLDALRDEETVEGPWPSFTFKEFVNDRRRCVCVV
jgi:hypothetical protein